MKRLLPLLLGILAGQLLMPLLLGWLMGVMRQPVRCDGGESERAPRVKATPPPDSRKWAERVIEEITADREQDA